MSAAYLGVGEKSRSPYFVQCTKAVVFGEAVKAQMAVISGGQSTQIKYLSKSTDTYTKILLQ